MADSIDDKLNIKLGILTGDFSRGLNDTSRMLAGFAQKFRDVVQPTGIDTAKMAEDSRKAERELSRIERAAKGASTAIGWIGKGVAAGVGFTLASAGLESIGQAIHAVTVGAIGAAAENERLSASFGVMVGDAEQGRKILNDVYSMSMKSPYGSNALASNAQQLLAFGVSPDQVAPTLKRLGDIAVGDTEKLGRLAHAYGQVMTSGILNGVELREFTMSGVPLPEYLAKVTGKSEMMVRLLTEQRIIGRPEFMKAIDLMTSPGGRYAGFSDKFLETFPGQIQRLKGGFEIFQREMGGMLIKELGLGDATRDLTKFEDKMHIIVDELRPAAQWAGRIAYAFTQVAYEAGRAAYIIGRTGVDMLDRAIPGVGLGDKIREILDDLKDFKIDPVKVFSVGKIMMAGFMSGLSNVAVYLVNNFEPVWEKGRAWVDYAVKSFEDLFTTVMDGMKALEGTAKDISDLSRGMAPTRLNEDKLKTQVGQANNEMKWMENSFNKAMAMASPTSTVEEAGVQKWINNEWNKYTPGERKRAFGAETYGYLSDEVKGDFRRRAQQWFRDDAMTRAMGIKDNAAKKIEATNQLLAANFAGSKITSMFNIPEVFKNPSANKTQEAIRAGMTESKIRSYQDLAAKYLAKSMDDFLGMAAPAWLHNTLPGNPKGNAFGSVLGGAGFVPAPVAQPRFNTGDDGKPDFRQTELLMEMQSKFDAFGDPVKGFNKLESDLKKIVLFGGSPEWASRMYVERIHDKARDYGLDQPTRFAPAVDLGSPEAAKLQVEALQGGANNDIKSILQQIADYEARQNELTVLLLDGIVDFKFRPQSGTPPQKYDMRP